MYHFQQTLKDFETKILKIAVIICSYLILFILQVQEFTFMDIYSIGQRLCPNFFFLMTLQVRFKPSKIVMFLNILNMKEE